MTTRPTESTGDELREAVDNCYKHYPGFCEEPGETEMRRPNDPCWSALLLAAAREKRVLGLVITAMAQHFARENRDVSALWQLLTDIESGAVTLHIDQKEGA